MSTPLFRRVLVTGCGGDIGLNIGRILKEEGLAETVLGSDIHDDHAGTILFDGAPLLPRANDDAYLPVLTELVRDARLDLVIPTSEPELRFFTENGIEWAGKTPLLMASRKARMIGFDKLETARFLQRHGLPAPKTVATTDGPPPTLPCILKPRFGAGSRNVEIIRAEEEAASFARRFPGGIWQELLTPVDAEYTCGLYRSFEGEIRTVQFHRTLGGGVTKRGIVVREPEIETLLVAVAEGINLRGSINVQLILTAEGPRIFEINPRFSSTVGFRHRLGFADLRWSLEELKGIPLSSYMPPPVGKRFYRIDRELFS